MADILETPSQQRKWGECDFITGFVDTVTPQGIYECDAWHLPCERSLLLRIPSSGDHRYRASLYVRQCSDNDHQLLTPQSPLLLRIRDMLISPSNSRRPDTILLMMADTKAGLGSTTISSYHSPDISRTTTDLLRSLKKQLRSYDEHNSTEDGLMRIEERETTFGHRHQSQ